MQIVVNCFLFSRIQIEDVQKLIDKSFASRSKARAISLETYNYTEYHPMGEVGQKLHLKQKWPAHINLTKQ